MVQRGWAYILQVRVQFLVGELMPREVSLKATLLCSMVLPFRLRAQRVIVR